MSSENNAKQSPQGAVGAPSASGETTTKAGEAATGSGPYEVAADHLRWCCDVSVFDFKTTKDLPVFEGIISQERAVSALKLGLQMRSRGYNIYVAGLPGTGRTTTVRHLLGTIDSGRGIPPDIVFVNNFRDADRPRAILLPAGQGVRLRRDMEDLVFNMRRNISQIYDSDDFKERMKSLLEEFKEREKAVVRAFEEHIRKENFVLVQVQMGPFSKPEMAPLIAGEPVQMEQLEALVREGKFSQEEFDRLKRKYDELSLEMEKTFRAARNLKRELRDASVTLQKDFAAPAVNDYIADLRAEYDNEEVREYLEQIQEAVVDNMQRFLETDESQEQQPKPSRQEEIDARYRDFSVNVLVDNANAQRSPVVIETIPNYRNLFGTIDRVVDRSGHWVTDFTRIKSGSLLAANGGTLVINLLDAIVEPGVWVALKRTLKHQKVDIQTFDPFYLFSLSALKPEPIQVDVKVIVLGDPMAYEILNFYDPDFAKIFKVKAEFDTEMTKDRDNLEKYVNFASKITSDEGLLPLEKAGVGALVEQGIRMSGRRNKLSARFSHLADIIREADHWARQQSASAINADHVKQAIKARQERLNLSEIKLREFTQEKYILIDTTGSRVGQVNGLSVLSVGSYAFGQPSRITVKTSLGRHGIVNIEREAELSGKTHSKGVLILEGYFRSLFAGDKPLAVDARICFEQSYGGVDGDSASSTEVYGLLSALSDIPLRQDIAVTGSVNQHGEVQPIGGVNEKIEGFFAVCRGNGLTGTQGVMIPALNVPNLMLDDEVVTAVREGKFHIWAVSTIPQGIELLTGTPAGERGADGKYPPDSVFGKVDTTLRGYADLMKSFGSRDGDEGPDHRSGGEK